MRNPHVVALRYCLKTDPSLIFDKPPPREWETDQVTLCLAEDMLTSEMKAHYLTCKMKAHYATADAARAVVDPLLRAWELHVALSQGKQVMHFVYQKPEVIDLDPPPPGVPQVIQTTSIESVEAVDQVTVVLTQPHYPDLPTRFTASPDVETLWHRYEAYKQGRAEFLPMAYFCLSFVEWQAFMQANGAVKWEDRRSHAAKLYAIDRPILKKLGDLTAERGDQQTARKMDRKSSGLPLTTTESSWIDAAIKMLIRRVGEHAAHPAAPGPYLSMADLPPL